MKLTNENPNYSATVIEISSLRSLEGLDNLQGIPVFGETALVSKDHEVGELGIVFTAETQLSEDFVKNNNLYRKSELNASPLKTGYLEINRRVKAIRLRGHISSALFLPIDCIEYLGVDPSELKIGDSFTHVNGVEICRKYIIQEANPKTNKTKGKKKKFEKISTRTFPEHYDTLNYWKNAKFLHDNDEIVVTSKLHGTSARFGNQLLDRPKSIFEKALSLLGFNIQTKEYNTIAGTRRVIKDKISHDSFYKHDVWLDHLSKIKHLIPKNWILYGEIIGWAGNSPIQTGYTYNLKQGSSNLYIYRITIVNDDGYIFELSWDQVKNFCESNGLEHVPELWRGKHKDFNVDDWMDKRYFDDGFLNSVQLGDNNDLVDEGICIRRDVEHLVLKAKSPKFLLHETKMLDS